MAEGKKLDNIPRGNTAPGVTRLIAEGLFSSLREKKKALVLDIPCGKGEFLNVLKSNLPDVETIGADINIPNGAFNYKFHQIDAVRPFKIDPKEKFDAITCISGVMEFDNTLSFFEQIRDLLDSDGEFFVTNDNLLSIRDRLLYFLFGRFRQYRHSIKSGTTTWKIIPLQNMLRILSDAQFRITRIIYVPPKFTEWLWLPLALPVYIAQYIYLKFLDKGIEKEKIREMFPFVSLLSRHYILICRPKP
jgi:SAM-dependent methyltransferase